MTNIRPPIVTITIATQLDLPGVASLVDAVLPDNRFDYVGNIIRAGCINLVASHEKRIVGYITVLVDGPNPNGKAMWERIRPYIGFVGVLPEARSCGIGSELVRQACIFVFLSSRERFVYLECDASLTGLYEKCGFEQISPAELEHQFGPNSAGSVILRISRETVLG